MSVQSLAPTIFTILTAPATDLSTVSAKCVRKQLLELKPDITVDFIKQNKNAIDKLIGTIFESLNVQVDLPTESSKNNGKRKRDPEIKEEENNDEENDEKGRGDFGDEDITSPPPSLKKAGKGPSQKLTDEEYARQLSSELNQRPSRGNRKSNGLSKKSASRSPKKKKSKPEIEDSDEDDENDSASRKRKPKKRNTGNGDAKGGFAKEFTLSDPLSVVVNAPQLSRPQVVKRLWEYIKANELQNPSNKREIICDKTLRAVFNVEKIDMFTMNKVLSGHLYEPES